MLTKTFLTKRCKSIVRGEWMQSKKLFLSSAILFVLVSFLFVGSVSASSELWSQTYGGKSTDIGRSLVETSDGGYAIAGETNSFGAGKDDFWLVKIDSNGNMEWNRTYGGVEPDRVYSLIETSDGGYALLGYTYVGVVNHDILLIKTDANGNMEWNRTYRGAKDEMAYSLVETSDGGYALAGNTNDDFLLVKTDLVGNIVWSKTYGAGTANSLIKTSDGGYALAGGGRLVKTDEHGNMEWNQTYSKGSIRSFVETSDGGYALAGSSPTGFLESSFYADFYLAKTDEYGNVEWNRTYNGKGIENAYSLVETSDGGYALAGETATLVYGSADFWLVKTDDYGNVKWNQTYGGANNEGAYSLVETFDGGYALAGYTESFGAGSYDFWLIKTDAQGIPEFPSWTPLLITLVALVAVMVVCRHKLNKQRRF
jgi:hypothetical protein